MISIEDGQQDGPRNVLGTALEACSMDPLTGFYRTGCCETGPDDHGRHTVCVRVDETFLAFSRSRGNDLSTPMPQYCTRIQHGNVGVCIHNANHFSCEFVLLNLFAEGGTDGIQGRSLVRLQTRRLFIGQRSFVNSVDKDAIHDKSYHKTCT